MNELKIGNQSLPSTVKDPFGKQSIKKITVTYSAPFWAHEKDWSARGTVYFENGNTKGEQQFEEKDFDEVVLKIKQFIQTELK
jgi:hypothetical protein